MGRTRRNCPVFGCGISLKSIIWTLKKERKKWLKWSKIGICVPLKDKDASKKDLHMALRQTSKHFRETSKLAGGNSNKL